MASRIASIYRLLPPSLQSLAATLHGYRLWHLRYGPNTDRQADEALAHDRIPIELQCRLQEERLQATLRHAVDRVPFYRRYWSSEASANKDSTKLSDWPILEKDSVRRNPFDFLADGFPASRQVAEHTSGTSGTPLTLWWSHEATRRHFALFEARWRRWYGVTRYDRWAMVGGRSITPVHRRRPPFWVWNGGMNQLYMSAYHVSADTASHYLDAMQHYRVRYLWGYTSSLYALACEALAAGRTDVHMTVAITNAEPISSQQRSVISRAFQCPVRETYGMAELVACAGECEAGRLHLWPETGIVEIVDGDRPVPAGQTGDIVATGLLNDAMPLIRYRIGDRGARAPASTTCECGRTLPLLLSVEGRSDDVLHTPDGRLIGRLDTVFKSDWPIREAQIVQEQIDRLRLRFVPAEGYDESIGCQMIAALRDRFGDVQVELERTTAIERTAGGKFRAVVCNLPADVRAAASKRRTK